MMKRFPVTVLFGALALVPREVWAAPCSDLPNPVYLQVGDTQEPLMKQLGRRLRENTANPIINACTDSLRIDKVEQVGVWDEGDALPPLP